MVDRGRKKEEGRKMDDNIMNGAGNVTQTRRLKATEEMESKER